MTPEQRAAAEQVRNNHRGGGRIGKGERMRLPHDICRCRDADCPERHDCERWLQREPKDLPTWARLTFADSLRAGDVCHMKIETKEHA